MTEYMRDTIAVWKELGIDPDCICTGFILAVEQADLILANMDQMQVYKGIVVEKYWELLEL